MRRLLPGLTHAGPDVGVQQTLRGDETVAVHIQHHDIADPQQAIEHAAKAMFTELDC